MIFLIIVLIVVAAVLMISYLAYRKVFHELNNRTRDPYVLPNGEQYQKDRARMLDLISQLDNLPYEEVFITASDGTPLFGRYYHVQDGAPLHIQMHGYRGFAVRDFCGGNKIAREEKQNTLLIDQRGHGRSGGHTITFGVKEQDDCMQWIAYANKRFGENTPIILSGVSMGATTVLLAAANNLPENVIGVIADCPFSSARAIIEKVCRDMKLPPKGAWPLVKAGARIFGRFDIEKSDAVKACAKIKIPVLLIHGEADLFVPCQMSRELYEANKERISLELFPQAGHGISYIVDTDRYTDLSVSSAKKWLG